MNKGLWFASSLLGGLYLSQSKRTECCGIVGVLSGRRENVSSSLSMGVELLKNRGYDSAGIVTFTKNEEGKVAPTVVKHAEEGFNAINCIDRLVTEVA